MSEGPLRGLGLPLPWVALVVLGKMFLSGVLSSWKAGLRVGGPGLLEVRLVCTHSVVRRDVRCTQVSTSALICWVG